MMKTKLNVVRSKKAMTAANGRPCTNCGKQDGTVVRCHYTGIRQHAYGKGMSQKGHDSVAADLCRSCHESFDRYEKQKGLMSLEDKIDLSEQFLHCVALTITRDIQDGVLVYA